MQLLLQIVLFEFAVSNDVVAILVWITLLCLFFYKVDAFYLFIDME